MARYPFRVLIESQDGNQTSYESRLSYPASASIRISSSISQSDTVWIPYPYNPTTDTHQNLTWSFVCTSSNSTAGTSTGTDNQYYFGSGSTTTITNISLSKAMDSVEEFTNVFEKRLWGPIMSLSSSKVLEDKNVYFNQNLSQSTSNEDTDGITDGFLISNLAGGSSQSAFIDTSKDVVYDSRQVYNLITGSMFSCSFQDSRKLTSPTLDYSKPFSMDNYLSASLSGSNDSGSIVFNKILNKDDSLYRYKFYGQKVCSVLGLQESQWIYPDQIRLTADDDRNYFQGDIAAKSLFVEEDLSFSNISNIASDVRFRVDTGSSEGTSDKFLKWVDTTTGIPTNKLRIGYNAEKNIYEMIADGVDFNIEGISTLSAEEYVVSSSVSYITTSFSSGSTIFGDTPDDTHVYTGSILHTGSYVNETYFNLKPGSSNVGKAFEVLELDNKSSGWNGPYMARWSKGFGAAKEKGNTAGYSSSMDLYWISSSTGQYCDIGLDLGAYTGSTYINLYKNEGTVLLEEESEISLRFISGSPDGKVIPTPGTGAIMEKGGGGTLIGAINSPGRSNDFEISASFGKLNLFSISGSFVSASKADDSITLTIDGDTKTDNLIVSDGGTVGAGYDTWVFDDTNNKINLGNANTKLALSTWVDDIADTERVLLQYIDQTSTKPPLLIANTDNAADRAYITTRVDRGVSGENRQWSFGTVYSSDSFMISSGSGLGGTSNNYETFFNLQSNGDGTAYLGINTGISTPTTALQVEGSISASDNLYLRNDGQTLDDQPNIYIQNDHAGGIASIGFGSGSLDTSRGRDKAQIVYNNRSTTDPLFRFLANDADIRFEQSQSGQLYNQTKMIISGGNIGMGHNFMHPSHTLNVSGTISGSSDFFVGNPAGNFVSWSDGGTFEINLDDNAANEDVFKISVDNSEKFTVDEDGDVVAGGNITADDGYVKSSDGYFWGPDSNTSVSIQSTGIRLRVNDDTSPVIWADDDQVQIGAGTQDADVKIGLVGATAWFDYGTNHTGLGTTTPGANVATLTTSGSISGSGNFYLEDLAYIHHNHFDTGSFTNKHTYGAGGDSQGDIVKFGTVNTGTMVAGKLYYLNTDGLWVLADASDNTAGADELLAIALGDDPADDGMLLRGVVRVDAITGTNVGQPYYMSETAGAITQTKPADNNEIVRIIGYLLHATNKVIYFNPSSTWIKVSA